MNLLDDQKNIFTVANYNLTMNVLCGYVLLPNSVIKYSSYKLVFLYGGSKFVIYCLAVFK